MSSQFYHFVFDMCQVEGLKIIIMSLILIENCLKITKIHYENTGCVKTTYCKISNIFCHYNHPSETAIKNSVDKIQAYLFDT